MIWIVALFKLLYKKMLPKGGIIRQERISTAESWPKAKRLDARVNLLNILRVICSLRALRLSDR